MEFSLVKQGKDNLQEPDQGEARGTQLSLEQNVVVGKISNTPTPRRQQFGSERLQFRNTNLERVRR
jgi:hypothetical protein